MQKMRTTEYICEITEWKTFNAAFSRSWEGSRQTASPRKAMRTWRTSDQLPTVNMSTSKPPSRSTTVSSRTFLPVCRCWSSVQKEEKKLCTMMLRDLLCSVAWSSLVFWDFWVVLLISFVWFLTYTLIFMTTFYTDCLQLMAFIFYFNLVSLLLSINVTKLVSPLGINKVI